MTDRSHDYLNGLEERIAELELSNDRVVKKLEEFSDVLTFFRDARVGFAIIVALFKVARWVGVAGLILWGAYYAWRHGTAPPPPL